MAKPARSILLVRFEDPPLPDDDDHADRGELIEADEAESHAPARLARAPVYEPLGTRRELEHILRSFNVAHDGSADAPTTLYGPGIIVTMPMVGPDEEVSQLLVSITEESIAWQVIMRLCAELRLRMAEAG